MQNIILSLWLLLMLFSHKWSKIAIRIREKRMKAQIGNRISKYKNEMKRTEFKTKITKTKVFNVIILDRSGSMETIRSAAISGLNETLASIQKAQKKFSKTQEHFVTLVMFCSCETKLFFDKFPIGETHPLKWNDYEPCCCTPLFDAMGFTLTAMRKYIKDMKDVAVVVTIITDGLENESKEYSGQNIKHLIEELRGEGWTFTYMGANQDAVEVAMSLSIRNSRNFEYITIVVCAKACARTAIRV